MAEHPASEQRYRLKYSFIDITVGGLIMASICPGCTAKQAVIYTVIGGVIHVDIGKA